MLPELLNQTPSRVTVLFGAFPLRGIESRQPVGGEALAEHFQKKLLSFRLEDGTVRYQCVQASDEGEIVMPILLCVIGVLLLVTTFAWRSHHQPLSQPPHHRLRLGAGSPFGPLRMRLKVDEDGF